MAVPNMYWIGYRIDKAIQQDEKKVHARTNADFEYGTSCHEDVEAFNTCALYCEQLDEKGLALRANMIVEHASDFTKELEKRMEAQDE